MMMENDLFDAVFAKADDDAKTVIVGAAMLLPKGDQALLVMGVAAGLYESSIAAALEGIKAKGSDFLPIAKAVLDLNDELGGLIAELQSAVSSLEAADAND